MERDLTLNVPPSSCTSVNFQLFYLIKVSFLVIIQMDSKRTPHEKMLSITECSKNIYKAINISSSNKQLASADDYLPAFIYIVIKTNPPLLYSNMNYIARFAFEKRVLQGEHAYYFCTLVRSCLMTLTILLFILFYFYFSECSYNSH